MKSSDILLSLDFARLEVWKVCANTFCVAYANCSVKDRDGALSGEFGRGTDFETACDSYLSKIRGKTLIFEKFGKRREVTVLG